MASYRATIDWALADGDDFAAGRYSRAHTLSFDGGVVVTGSASPHVVRAPFSVEAAVDPEEAFVASLSACHMLWFLHLARDAGLTVASYRDEAEGVMAKNENGKLAMTKVTLRPYIVFKGNQPSPREVDHLHHRAHDECYIANSVKTDVAIEPQSAPADAE
ncbi:MAG TPA: OsmC family protein [Caulobacteraceae bacterium]|nr:OsmC family protein [Caulobacteraceae bacterium]